MKNRKIYDKALKSLSDNNIELVRQGSLSFEELNKTWREL